MGDNLGFEIVINAAQGLNTMTQLEKRIEAMDKIMSKVSANPKNKITIFDSRQFEREVGNFTRIYARMGQEIESVNDRIRQAEAKREEASKAKRGGDVRRLDEELKELRSRHSAMQSNQREFGARFQDLRQEHDHYGTPQDPTSWKSRLLTGAKAGALGAFKGAANLTGLMGGFSLINLLHQAAQTYEGVAIAGQEAGAMAGSRNVDAYANRIRSKGYRYGFMADESFAMSNAYAGSTGHGLSGGMMGLVSKMSRASGMNGGEIAGSVGYSQRMLGSSDKEMHTLARYIGDEVEKVGMGRLPELLNVTRTVADSLQGHAGASGGAGAMAGVMGLLSKLGTNPALTGEKGLGLYQRMDSSLQGKMPLMAASILALRRKMGLKGRMDYNDLEEQNERQLGTPGFVNGEFAKGPNSFDPKLAAIAYQIHQGIGTVKGGKLTDDQTTQAKNILARFLDRGQIKQWERNGILNMPDFTNAVSSEPNASIYHRLTESAKGKDGFKAGLAHAQASGATLIQKAKTKEESIMAGTIGSVTSSVINHFKVNSLGSLEVGLNGGKPTADSLKKGLGNLDETTKGVIALGASNGNPIQFAAAMVALHADTVMDVSKNPGKAIGKWFTEGNPIQGVVNNLWNGMFQQKPAPSIIIHQNFHGPTTPDTAKAAKEGTHQGVMAALNQSEKNALEYGRLPALKQ